MIWVIGVVGWAWRLGDGVVDLFYMDIAIGKYRHFKGAEYEVIGVARSSETMEEMVVYRALYGEMGLWVRPLEMFLETVVRDGVEVRRFAKVD